VNHMLERTAWLADDVLLLAGPGSEADQQELEASTAAIGDRTLDVVTRALALSNGSEDAPRLLAVSRFESPLNGAVQGLTMTFGPGGRALPLDAAQLVDSAVLLREELSRLDPRQRAQALHFLWRAVAPSLERSGSFPLAQLLADLHSEFRPQLAQMFRSSDEHYAAHVDLVLKLDERSLWVQGWMHDRDDTTTRVTLVAPEGGRAELLSAGLFRHRRQDMEEVFADKVGVRGQRHGFMGVTRLDGPSQVSHGWLVELETAAGDRRQRPVPSVETDPITTRARVLGCLPFERPGSDELMRKHVHPAMSRIQDGLRDTPAIETVVQLGEPPAAPSVSVIVPLYSKLWFLEYQMAHWARDPQLPREDLIYVLDTPGQAAVLEELAHGLHSMYGIPFRLAVMKGNAGLAGVNNCAAELARAGKLLLLNSDVVPDAPGWLGRMTAFYDATPDIGALGAKLLYEDDSLQHAGVYFRRSLDSPLWDNVHYFKGQHRSLPAANAARQVPAVTGACMMVERGLYERVGGLSHRYLVGGYEDSDFCLRLIEESREHWYMPGAELYHLENQSYPAELRKLTSGYNRWLHTELWGERMEHVMAQYPGLSG
jgi:O-antigen biosynthesis protein